MIERAPPRPRRRLPDWLKVKAPGGPNYLRLRSLLRAEALNTVCEEAHCPNIGECWDLGTATFMILGDICTRACTYCAVTSGRPLPVDPAEPIRLASSVERMGLRYAVITSVDRDDLPDAGASMFAECIHQIRKRVPGCRIEVLIPDFGGMRESLQAVMDAGPDTLNHNIETVRRVFPRVRARGDYDLSLELIARAGEMRPEVPTKSGMMVGLGETYSEVIETMRDLRSVDCNLLTIGQYLRPSQKHAPMTRWWTPQEFDELREEGLSMGFRHVASGPLVRSSYHAGEQHAAATS
ncbi:MAG: lipoyl synthase [Dehalococcoidia bacterium]|nr:lipoyl synthase [Dehalococcoidia bacterium]